MASNTKDFRGEITEETDIWLETEVRVYGRTKQDVVRELLHAHALKKIQEASVLTSLAAANGLTPERCRNLPEDTGARRSGRR